MLRTHLASRTAPDGPAARRLARLRGAAALAGAALLLLGASQTSEVEPRAAVAPRADAAVAPAQSGGAAPPPLSFRDQLLATGVKLLVETTVQHVDFEKAKINAAREIREKPASDYRRQMNRVFDDLESVDVHEVLGVNRDSSQEQLIAVIERTNQAELLDAMNGIPDKSIAELLGRKLREKGASSLVEAHEYFDTELNELVNRLSG